MLTSFSTICSTALLKMSKHIKRRCQSNKSQLMGQSKAMAVWIMINVCQWLQYFALYDSGANLDIRRIRIFSKQLSSIHMGTSIIRRCLFEWDKMPYMRDGRMTCSCWRCDITDSPFMLLGHQSWWIIYGSIYWCGDEFICYVLFKAVFSQWNLMSQEQVLLWWMLWTSRSRETVCYHGNKSFMGIRRDL